MAVKWWHFLFLHKKLSPHNKLPINQVQLGQTKNEISHGVYCCLKFDGTYCQLKQTRPYIIKGAGQISIRDLKIFEAWPNRCIWPGPLGIEGRTHWSYWIRAHTPDGPGPTIIYDLSGFKFWIGGWLNKPIVPGSSIKTMLVNPTIHRGQFGFQPPHPK